MKELLKPWYLLLGTLLLAVSAPLVLADTTSDDALERASAVLDEMREDEIDASANGEQNRELGADTDAQKKAIRESQGATEVSAKVEDHSHSQVNDEDADHED
ncbi:MAG: hypothetical protein H6822_19265 [Planctomycetaceae bacterium]|nr:hypothetical protein [Planctomycetales bacterium]MCB9924326.1 hypothetical protein [Planctomycetaceae bacterium]